MKKVMMLVGLVSAPALAASEKPAVQQQKPVKVAPSAVKKPRGGASAVNAKRALKAGRAIEFHPQLSTANQLSKVQVRAYDPVKRKEIVGKAAPATKLGDK